MESSSMVKIGIDWNFLQPTENVTGSLVFSTCGYHLCFLILTRMKAYPSSCYLSEHSTIGYSGSSFLDTFLSSRTVTRR